MKKLWQMIKGCPLFTILILSGIIVTAGGYAGAALGIYKWDVTFKHPMVQTVLLDEKAESGSESDASEVSTAKGDLGKNDQHKDVDNSTETVKNGKPLEKTEEQTDGKSEDKSDAKTTEKSSEKNTEKSTEKGSGKTTEKTTKKSTEKKTEATTEKKASIDTGGSSTPISRPTQYKKIKTRKSRNNC